MLTLSELKPFFPEELHRFPRFMLREYLQCKILEIIFGSPHATGLCFLGGTCLRIVHANRRFSEDLDFDNITLKEEEFDRVTEQIKKQLNREGFETQLKMVKKGAWHCNIKFPGLLYKEGLSGHRQETILIQVDTEPQKYIYEPERHILNRFDVFTTILTTPLPLLMAQKLYATINRARNKGRDFYDLIFLMSRNIQPDYQYLKDKISVSNPEALKKALLEKCRHLNMETMAKDVEPFLFNPSDSKKLMHFEALVEQYQF